MKKLILFAAAAVAALTMASCSGSNGIDLTNESDVASIPEQLAKHIGEDAEIISIHLFAGDHFKFTMKHASVIYLTPGAEEANTYNIYFEGSAESKKGEVNIAQKRYATHENAVKLSEIDFTQITTLLNQAKEMLDEDGYAFSGVATYHIDINGGKIEKTKHYFTTESRGESKMTTRGGKLTEEITYYESTFSKVGDGELEMLE